MTNRKLLFLAILALALPLLAPGDAYAVQDRLTTYYTGNCSIGLSYNGYHFRECSGAISYDGTLDGTWKCDDRYDCSEGTFTYYWYEKCNGVWVFRYAVPDVNSWPESEDCQCS